MATGWAQLATPRCNNRYLSRLWCCLLWKTRYGGVVAILRLGRKQGVPLRVFHAILRVVRHTTHPTTTQTDLDGPDCHPTIRDAIKSQHQIGLTRMVVTGFLSTQWFEAIQACPNVQYPQQYIGNILALIWDKSANPSGIAAMAW